jgi:ABC-type multidrug transport system fused ATPase/permease subunit
LLKNSRILILDEATSALDSVTEKKIYDNIQNNVEQTKIIISHRLTSLVTIRRIIVLDKGKIVGCGNHNELLETCPIYRELYKTQNILS